MIEIILEALRSGRNLTFTAEGREWMVHPHSLVVQGAEDLVLIGWCPTIPGAWREFPLDGLRDARCIDRPAATPVPPPRERPDAAGRIICTRAA